MADDIWPPVGVTSAESKAPVQVKPPATAYRVRIVDRLYKDIIVDNDLTVTQEWTVVPADKIELVRRTAGRGQIRIEEEEEANG
jgi:hypothetical protein